MEGEPARDGGGADFLKKGVAATPALVCGEFVFLPLLLTGSAGILERDQKPLGRTHLALKTLGSDHKITRYSLRARGIQALRRRSWQRKPSLALPPVSPLV